MWYSNSLFFQNTEIKANTEDDERKTGFFRQHSDKVILFLLSLLYKYDNKVIGIFYFKWKLQ